MVRHHLRLLIACVFCCAYRAAAYPTPVDFDGSLMRWDIHRDSPTIVYEISADQAEDLDYFGDTVRESAQLWTDIATSYFTYREAEEGETAAISIKLKTSIEGGTYAAGYTVFDEYNEEQPSKPKHASIYIAVNNDQSYYAIAKTILHELGHGAGLGHTMIPEAIMSYSLDKNFYGLDIDDEAAVTRLYPLDGDKPRLPPGCAVGSHDQRQASPTLILLLAPFLLATLRIRRKTEAYGTVKAAE